MFYAKAYPIPWDLRSLKTQNSCNKFCVVNNILRQNLGEIFILFELLNSMWKCTEFEVNKERKDVFFTTSFQLLLSRFMRLNGTFFLKIYI